MALPATDTFTGSNGTDLEVYSSNWTQNGGLLEIYNNAVVPGDNTESSLAHWNADTFNNDQYAQGTIVSVSSYAYIGVAVRVGASGLNDYGYSGTSGDREVYKYVGGSYTSIAWTDSGGFSANDDIRLEASGTTLTPILNDVTDSLLGAQTDESHSSGYAGLNGYDIDNDAQVDDWEGGNLSSGPVLTAEQVNNYIHLSWT